MISKQKILEQPAATDFVDGLRQPVDRKSCLIGARPSRADATIELPNARTEVLPAQGT